MYNIEELKEYLKNNLSEKRYNHSLLVADAAASLATHYKLDSNKAYIAGLVHDIAKELSEEENSYYINKYGVDNKYLIEDLKPVLHSFVGELLIKEKYGMDDEICSSVRYHTLGNIDMSLFDKIILIADKIGRINKDEKLVNLAFNNIDETLINIIEYQKNKLESNNKKLHEDTQSLYDKLKKIHQNKDIK